MSNDLQTLRNKMAEAAHDQLAGDVMVASMDAVYRAVGKLNSAVAWDAAATAFELKAAQMRANADRCRAYGHTI